MIIEFSLAGPIDIVIVNDSGFSLRRGDLKEFLVLLDLNRLFEGLNLSQATVDQHGIVRIDEQSNTAFASQLKQRLTRAFRGGEDANGDGIVD
jgi:hypothetical protein